MDRRTSMHVIAASSLALTGIASAQSYPQRPIRLVVGFSPGGSTDVAARRLGLKLANILGQPVVVENKLGAAGAIATAEVARAAPDGYTLQMATSGNLVINPHTMAKPGYSPLTDFIPIYLVCTQPLAVSVHPSFPARTFQEFLSVFRSEPGKYSYASSGNGGIAHCSAEWLKDRAGLQGLLHIPYKGGADAATAVISGQVPILLCNTFSIDLTHHRTGRLRTLATTGALRSQAAPEIPTVKESGIPDYVAISSSWLTAPAKTSDAVVEQIAQAIRTAMTDTTFVGGLTELGNDMVIDSDPAKAKAFLKSEFENWGAVIKKAKISSET